MLFTAQRKHDPFERLATRENDWADDRNQPGIPRADLQQGYC